MFSFGKSKISETRLTMFIRLGRRCLEAPCALHGNFRCLIGKVAIATSARSLENVNAEVVKEVLESKLEELTNEDLLNCDVQNSDIDDSEEDEEDSSGNKVKAFSLKELRELPSAAEALKEKAVNAVPDIGRSMQFGRE
ncbi:hypothetical protein M514_09013, partial [Trichuris suis]